MAFEPETAPEPNQLAGREAMSGEKPQERALDKLLRWADLAKTRNIAEELDDMLLNTIGLNVVREYDIDKATLDEWREKTEKAMELAMQVKKPKTYPWPNAANVIFPLMTTAAVQFAARAYPAIVSGRNVVKGVVVGDDKGVPAVDPQTMQPVMKQGEDGQPQPEWRIPPGEKRRRADKIGEHMSWQLLNEQPEWEPETDQLLHLLPIVGCVFRKTYFEPEKGRNCSFMVSPMNFVVNYAAKSLETAPRLTEEIKFYPREIEERHRAGVFRKIEYVPPSDGDGDVDAPHEFLEQHRYLDLDEDGYPEPYCVTVHKSTTRVVRIVARYDADSIMVTQSAKVQKIEPIHYYTKYDFIPNPDGGIYGVGFGQLLKPINEAVNTTLNQLLDAGHLANTGGGFVGKSLSMHSGDIRFRPGEYKVVNASGNDIKSAIVPLQFPGPSPVLFNLLGLLIEAGKEISSVKDVLTGEVPKGNVPATTTLAMIEQGLKAFTAIYKRVHRSLKSELQKLYRLNRVYMTDGAGYSIGDEWKQITREDYAKGSGVEPISDPQMVSDMQRMGRAQFLLGFKGDQSINQMEINRRVLDAANIDNPDSLLVTDPPANPELIAKGLEMELRDREISSQERKDRASEAKDYALAVKAFADADAAIGNLNASWVAQQLEIIRVMIEAGNGGTGETGTGAQPSGLPGMEAPSGVEALPGLSQGLPGGAGNGMLPAMEGGRPPAV